MTTTRTGTSPRPWLAVGYSFLCTGLGQLYCGRTRRGLLFFLLSLLFGPAVAFAGMARPSLAALLALGGAVVFACVVFVVAVVDAGILARRLRREGSVRPGLGVPLTAAFVVVGLLYPFGAALWVRKYQFEVFRIPTNTMEPTLLPGDRILVDKHAWAVGGAERGDLIVFRWPDDGRYYVKRVIALGGDRVEVRGGEVRVNGSPLPRTPASGEGEGEWWETNGPRRYRVHDLGTAWSSPDLPEQEVPAEHLFVLGDRRGASVDSRRRGPVPRAGVVGLVRYVLWPAGSWARFGPLR